MMIFNALAYLPPFLPSHQVASTLQDEIPLLADSPHAAALKWFWRLGEYQRTACDRIVIWPGPENGPFVAYSGDIFVYRVRDRQLVQIEGILKTPLVEREGQTLRKVDPDTRPNWARRFYG